MKKRLSNFLRRIATSVSSAFSRAKYEIYKFMLSWLERGPKERLMDYLRDYVYHSVHYPPPLDDRYRGTYMSGRYPDSLTVEDRWSR